MRVTKFTANQAFSRNWYKMFFHKYITPKDIENKHCKYWTVSIKDCARKVKK